ncbi:pyridoxamine 5'-phosphate oxidase family protein [Thermomonospora umbrina]|uniref:Pyridoxamine 5'-phosphate oxidase-like protein n=1 Tax=Thermomonospora umbrina TaxID=111806 RepID=A0A3D9SFX4_9ACTN|nr:pyridoxamine 5'-phosphate oxidase family protein [Thermomonospora umbrina]REE94779.1 pyridoxamine 5'-phosphate oxidase-like protein [Thermomonospora umbrina]
MNQAGGSGGASLGRKLEEIDRDECLRLIAPGGVGRVAFDDGEGPTVIPVNYAVEGESVVFRTATEGRLNQSLSTVMAEAEVRIAFEVDAFDETDREGWSVLVRGGAHRMSEEEGADAAGVTPWPAGAREAYIRLSARSVSGRRVRRE